MGAHLSHPPRLAEQSISCNLGSSVRDISSLKLFQCKNPYTPNMRNTETWTASFNHRWEQEKMLVQAKELADAGFYFLGSHDRTKYLFLWWWFAPVIYCNICHIFTYCWLLSRGATADDGVVPSPCTLGSFSVNFKLRRYLAAGQNNNIDFTASLKHTSSPLLKRVNLAMIYNKTESMQTR